MGRGQRDEDSQLVTPNPPSPLPEAFYELPPREAAEQLIRHNLRSELRENTEIRFSERHRLTHSGRGSLCLELTSAGWNPNRTFLYLQVDEDNALLISGKSFSSNIPYKRQALFERRDYQLEHRHLDPARTRFLLKVVDLLLGYELWDTVEGQKVFQPEYDHNDPMTLLERRSPSGESLLHLGPERVADDEPARKLGAGPGDADSMRLTLLLLKELQQNHPPIQRPLQELTLSTLDRFRPDFRDLSLSMTQFCSDIAAAYAYPEAHSHLMRIQQEAPPLPVELRQRIQQQQQLQLQREELQRHLDKIAPQGSWIDSFGYLVTDPRMPEKQEPKNEQERLELEIMRTDALLAEIEISWEEMALYFFHQDLKRQLQQLRAAQDLDALEAMAASGQPWALARLHEQHPEGYVRVLEQRLQLDANPYRIELLGMLAEQDPGRALLLAEQLLEVEDPQLQRQAFRLLQQQGPFEAEAELWPLFLEQLRDKECSASDLEELIELLVPKQDARRYPQPELDEALLKLLQRSKSNPELSGVQAALFQALLSRDPLRQLPGLCALYEESEKLPNTLSAFHYESFYGKVKQLEALLSASRGHPHWEERVDQIFLRELQKRELNMEILMMMIWRFDLRHTRDWLSEAATGSPEEQESFDALLGRSSQAENDDRFHLARQILTLWDNEATVLQAKRLLAFAYQQPELIDMYPDPEEKLATFIQRFTSLRSHLSRKESRKLELFEDRLYQQLHMQSDTKMMQRDELRKVLFPEASR